MTREERVSRVALVILTLISVVVLGLGVQTVRASMILGGALTNQQQLMRCKDDHELRLRTLEKIATELETIASALENQGGKIFVRD